MKDKGRRDYTLNSTTRGPTKGVQFNLEAAVTRRSGQACSRLTRPPLHPASLAVVRRSRVARIRPSAGFNSGRRGGRPTIEGGLTLDLYQFIRRGLWKPGHYSTGPIFWTRVKTGERIASIGCEALLGGDAGHVRLRYTTTTYGG